MNIGDRIGSLVIIELGHSSYNGGQNNRAVKTKCDCGLTHIKPINYLNQNKYNYCCHACGLLNKKLDLIVPKDKYIVKAGEKYNFWKVLENPVYFEIKRPKKGRPNWRCREQYVKCECICGCQRNVICKSLISGHSKSCGCSKDKFKFYKGTPVKNGIKKCCHCQINLSITEFSIASKTIDGYSNRCKECKRVLDILSRYDITKEQYDEMFNRQNGVCGICFREGINSHMKNLCIDHCHKTGKIRGLLCSTCNTALGKFQDNTDFLKNAIKYLELNS